jgi:thiamine-phosphate pyrophosphorylase
MNRLPKFYPILTQPVIWMAEAILEGGAAILQLRHKGFFSREVFEQARQISDLCRSATARFVINDRADIAMLLGSALHVGQDDLPPSDARRILPSGSFIGFSTHNEQQLRAGDSEPVDYLAIGPIFGTRSKDNPDPAVGIERLRALRSIAKKPLVAIGGITRETAPLVFEAGADSVAIISDLYPEPLTKSSLRARTEQWVALCEHVYR